MVFFESVLALEFLYPVGYVKQNGKIKIYIIYQKSIGHIELWLWDPETKVASKGLLSTYTPAAFKLLPDNAGFSFIDNGRIKIKKFNKRSPRSIDIYDPIYNICGLKWIDSENFYISAKKDDKFKIFKMDISGAIKYVLEDKDKDCMYPQKIGNSIFYIERCIKKGVYKRDYLSYKVVSLDHPIANQDLDSNLQKNSEDKIKEIMQTDDCFSEIKILEPENKKYLVDFRSCPIAFLNMISDKEGFFLEHQVEVERYDKTIIFNYFQIKKGEDEWVCKELFQFSIPAHLILDKSDSRLYESILPLLPKYHDGKLFYLNCLHNKELLLDMFCYDLETEIQEQKTFAKSGQLFFSLIFTEDKIFYGGAVSKLSGDLPLMWISDDGIMCFKLPFIKLSYKFAGEI